MREKVERCRSSFYDYMVIWYINIIADFKSTIYIIQLLLH